MQVHQKRELHAAVRGDRAAFEALTEPHRRELQVHCYRMLGSLTDAEDLVQETMLRAWKGRHTYAGRSSFRAWLYRIATNACLDELAARPRRGLPASFSPPADPAQPMDPPRLDPIWLEPYPDSMLPSVADDAAARYDQGESVRLAFLVALQELPPRQRAILLLRDVLGFKAAEVSSLLDLSLSSVTSALFRARSTLSGLKSTKDAARGARPESAVEQEALARYLRAWETADIDGLTSLLREDATFPMPPLPGWYRGRTAIRAFLLATVLQGTARGRWRLVPTRANGRPAFGLYRKTDIGAETYAPFGIQVVTLKAGLVADATTFGFPQLFSIFELPSAL